jgi:hypothetical protein
MTESRQRGEAERQEALIKVNVGELCLGDPTFPEWWARQGLNL